MFEDFKGLIDEDIIEQSLINLGIITGISYRDLKEMYIDKQLSFYEIAEVMGCSPGHINKCITKYGLQKKNFGITTGNNQAVRRGTWRHNVRVSQPTRKAVIAFKANGKKQIAEADSISQMADILKIKREYIRDCLLPHKHRNTAMGYRFEHRDIL